MLSVKDCVRLCVSMSVAKGVCICGLHTHTVAGMGIATRSARAPLRDSEGVGWGRVREGGE